MNLAKFTVGALLLILHLWGGVRAQGLAQLDEGSVYSAAIREIQKRLEQDGHQSKRFVVLKESLVGADSERLRGRNSVDRNFNLQNRRSVPINENFYAGSATIVFVHLSEVEALIERSRREWEELEAKRFAETGLRVPSTCGAPWTYFNQRFEGAEGYYRLSRVEFSNDRRTANVEIMGAGGCWNSSDWFQFRWTSGRWKIHIAGGGYGVS